MSRIRWKQIKLVGILLVGFASGATYGQQDVEDRIQAELESLTSDTARIAWVLEKARSADIPASKIYIAKGIPIATQSNNSKALAELYTEEAILFNRTGQLSKGLESFQRVDSIAQLLQDTNKLAAVHTNIGLTQYYLGNLDQALSHYFAAYQHYKHLDRPISLSRLLNNLAMANKQARNYSLASRYYRESLQIKQSLGDSIGLATTLMNIGLLLAEQNRVVQAIDTLEMSRHLFEQIGMVEDVFGCQLSLGKVMLDAGQIDRAEPLLKESYKYFNRQKPTSREHLLAAGDLALLHALQDEWSSAGAYVNEAITLSRDAEMMENLQNLLKLKSEINYQLNQYQTGFDALYEAYVLRDSLNQTNRASLIEEMQARFDLDLKDQEIQLLNTQNQLHQVELNVSRTRIRWLFAIGILLAMFSIFFYTLYDRIRKQKRIIDQALADNQALMKEIHHRVKNNLQVISSLLSMQSFQMDDESALEAVRESQNRVQSMSIIHQKLYQDEYLTQVNTQEYIDQLARSLFDSYNVNPGRIKLQTSIESLVLDVDTMIPIGLTLNELISNALKYAFVNQSGGMVYVDLKSQNGLLKISVADNGVGLPSSFNVDTATSMGYQLINDFVRKLKGKLKIISNDGTQVSLEIPYPPS